ncbi:GNAT family N-acetyltransferase [Corynebacterium sp. 13CS0277]|uniref:GNAT family N-acetyltransferase n=1 Tax=Corynebacterium sp. 13CS0277 TaxID=2071994 RepID=UPI003514893B
MRRVSRMTHTAVLRPCRGPEEYSRLVDIWAASVEATHDFLAPEDFQEIHSHLASDYFPHVTLHVADIDGVVVGFSGVAEDGLEMLFLHPDAMGQGIGAALLRHAIDHGVRRVDVNEQNSNAAAFYLHHGFEVASRDEVDDAGRPYPILHLRLKDAV